MNLKTVVVIGLVWLSASMLGVELTSPVIMASQPTKPRSITFSTSIPPLILSKMDGYDTARISDCGVTAEIGRPMLPVKIVPVLLPPDGDVSNIELISSEKEDLTGSYRIFPAQYPAADVGSQLSKWVEPDAAVYESNEAYPGVLFENVGVQWMQGYKILNIRIFPVQYYPRDGKLTYYQSMEFTVIFTSIGSIPSRNTFASAKSVTSEIVVNPENVDAWVASSYEASSSPGVDYIIITSPLLQDEFQALVDWKIETGISAGVYNTTWIYSNYAGVDDQEKIRNFIIDMYNSQGTSMVLLGGDYDVVPARYVYIEDCLGDSREAGGGLTAHYKATDYYYACLDGDWDLDDDGKYLEQIDENHDDYAETCVEPIPDFYPEVYVGRMPASSETVAEFLVNRTIDYEKDPPSGDWMNKGILLGAISNYQNEDRKGWYKTDDAEEQEWVKDNLLTSSGYNVTTMYEKDGLSPSTYTCTVPLNQSNVQTFLSSGCWITSTAGHGDVLAQVRKIWDWDDGDGVPESSEMNWTPFIDSTTMSLFNGEKLPIAYIDACLNGKFDDAADDCVAEWLVKLSGGGAIAATAASRISYYWIGWQKGWPLNQEQLCLFWQEFFNSANEFRPGRALYESKVAYYLEGFDMDDCANKKNHLIYNLLGDPDVRVSRQHDLAVTLETPDSLEPSVSSPLNATVWNQGLNNETDVELFLLINGTVVNSTMIPELQSGASYTIDYSWTPTAEATYNVTAYTSSVLGEDFVANNFASEMVPVEVVPYVLIVADDDASVIPGGGTSLPEFESALTAAGYKYVVWRETVYGHPSLEFLLDFKLVIWTCGDHYDWAVDATDAATLEAYIAQGGNILLEGEDIGYNHEEDSFMVNVAHATLGIDDAGAPGLTVTDPDHPVTRDLPSSFSWLMNPQYADGVTPTNGGSEVINYTDTAWTAVTVFNGTGTTNGSVVYYAFPLYYLTQPEIDTLVINSVSWLLPRDIAIVNVTSSKNVVGQGHFTSIRVTVENQGDSAGTFNVTAYANTTIIETFVDIVVVGGNSIVVTFTWNTTDVACGNYTISATATTVPGEMDEADNTLVDGTVLVTFLSDIRGPLEPDHPPDGTVDMWDFGFIGLAYGKTSADPDWNDYKIADTRGPEGQPDGVVDMWDFGYCGLQYGSSI